jgi:hypothetical protein
MKNQTLSYLIPFIIGALISWAIIPRSNEVKTILQDKKETYLHLIDSIQKAYKELVERDTLQSRASRENFKAWKQASKESTYWKTKYEKAKNTPAVHYSGPQLDSAINSLVGQQPDSTSTEIHGVEIWKLRRLVKMSQDGLFAETIIGYQEEEINRGLVAYVSVDSLLDIRTAEIKSLVAEKMNYKGLYTTQVNLTNVEIKKKRKWMGIAIVAILVAVAK